MAYKISSLFTAENVAFDLSFDEITQKISQILPFSKVVIICCEDDFFSFGKRFFYKLNDYGLKPINLVYSRNIIFQIEDLCREYCFEDVRGVIVFDKKALNKIVQLNLSVKKIFYIQTNSDTYGIFYNQKNLDIEKEVNYFFNENLLDVFELRKSLALKTVHLIDYAFKNTLYNQRVETAFFSGVKKKLVSALFCLEGDFDAKKLFYLDLELDYLIFNSDYPFCSVNVCSFLFNKDFFIKDIAFYFSNLVVKCCKNFLSGKTVFENIDYSDRAKTVSFLLNADQNQILRDLKEQITSICDFNLVSVKQEIKKLIMLFQKFNYKKSEKVIFSLSQTEMAKTCLTVSGDTKFSVNFLTAFRENIIN